MNVNYYDYNSLSSCKIKGTVFLSKTQIATNLILIVNYEEILTEFTNSLTTE